MELDEALDTTVAEIMHHESEADVNVSRAGKLAQLLEEAGWITSETMIRVLRQGEIPLFEAMFAKHLGLRPRLLQRFLVEPGGEALAVACKGGIGMLKDDFATIFMLTRKARFGKRVISPSELNRILELYDRVGLEAARAMLDRWRRDPEYLNAIRILKKTGPDSKRNSGPFI